MNKIKLLVVVACSAILLAGCESQDSAPGPNLFELTAVGLTLQGPTEIPEGWTTIRFANQSPMIHLAMIDVPPDGVDAFQMKRELVEPYQDYLNAMNAGDDEAMQQALGEFPAWMSELYFYGGPGFLSAGHTSDATVNLKPGLYVLECYVMTNGMWHTYNPDPELLGMVLEFRVVESDVPTAPPAHDATIAISNDKLELVAGELKAGNNQIQVEFREQQVFENFLLNDVHVIRLDNEGDLEQASAWLDWSKPGGLQTPAPVTFLGGLNDMPEGSVGYFTVDLSPGDYAFITESPDSINRGLVLRFSID